MCIRDRTGPSEFPEEIKEKAEITSVRTEREDMGEKEVKDGEKSGETKGCLLYTSFYL